MTNRLDPGETARYVMSRLIWIYTVCKGTILVCRDERVKKKYGNSFTRQIIDIFFIIFLFFMSFFSRAKAKNFSYEALMSVQKYKTIEKGSYNI